MAALKALASHLDLRHYVLLAAAAVLASAAQLPEFASYASALEWAASMAAVAAGAHVHGKAAS